MAGGILSVGIVAIVHVIILMIGIDGVWRVLVILIILVVLVGVIHVAIIVRHLAVVRVARHGGKGLTCPLGEERKKAAESSRGMREKKNVSD